MKNRQNKTRDLNEQIYLPIWLIYRIQKHENWVEVIALYIFYFEQALRQGTNQPWATDEFCWKGLRIGKARFQKAKRILRDLKIIEQIQIKEKGKLFGKAYIRVNCLDNDLNIRTHQIRPSMENKGCEDGEDTSSKSGILGNPSVGEFPDASNPPSNAYIIKKNHLPCGEEDEGLPSVIIENKEKQTSFSNDKAFSLSIDEKINPSMFDDFWNIYPKHESPDSARREWEKLCKEKDSPTWREIKRAIVHQKQSERWQKKRFILGPTRWIKEKTWKVDPASFVDYSKKLIECPLHDGEMFFFGNQSSRQGCMDCEDEYPKIYKACGIETRKRNIKH